MVDFDAGEDIIISNSAANVYLDGDRPQVLQTPRGGSNVYV